MAKHYFNIAAAFTIIGIYVVARKAIRKKMISQNAVQRCSVAVQSRNGGVEVNFNKSRSIIIFLVSCFAPFVLSLASILAVILELSKAEPELKNILIYLVLGVPSFFVLTILISYRSIRLRPNYKDEKYDMNSD